jgi:hypothetical protein
VRLTSNFAKDASIINEGFSKNVEFDGKFKTVEKAV